MNCVCTNFGVDSSSRFPFRVRTHKQTDCQLKLTDVTAHSTHCTATAGVGSIIHLSTNYRSKQLR